jgi:hypothetical protein
VLIAPPPRDVDVMLPIVRSDERSCAFIVTATGDDVPPTATILESTAGL